VAGDSIPWRDFDGRHGAAADEIIAPRAAMCRALAPVAIFPTDVQASASIANQSTPPLLILDTGAGRVRTLLLATLPQTSVAQVRLTL
jgi:hypothetical protein